MTQTINAIQIEAPGGPDTMKLVEVDLPAPGQLRLDRRNGGEPLGDEPNNRARPKCEPRRATAQIRVVPRL